jgi:hypothetical protein
MLQFDVRLHAYISSFTVRSFVSASHSKKLRRTTRAGHRSNAGEAARAANLEGARLVSLSRGAPFASRSPTRSVSVLGEAWLELRNAEACQPRRSSTSTHHVIDDHAHVLRGRTRPLHLHRCRVLLTRLAPPTQGPKALPPSRRRWLHLICSP